MTRQAINFSLPAGTFSDGGSALTYSATQVKGRQLGVSFDAATQTFSGTLQGRRSVATFEVTATNSAGLSASEYFTATIASNAAQFAHAVSAINGTGGVATTSLQEVFGHAAHTLASPMARG